MSTFTAIRQWIKNTKDDIVASLPAGVQRIGPTVEPPSDQHQDQSFNQPDRLDVYGAVTNDGTPTAASLERARLKGVNLDVLNHIHGSGSLPKGKAPPANVNWAALIGTRQD
jgi:hypothetical protein